MSIESMQQTAFPSVEIGTPRSAPRLAFLDGIRGAAALYVVCHHIAKHLHLESASGPIRLLARLLDFGHYAVSIFIVLSGFCLMLPIVRGDGTLRGGPGRFFRRRARRILPPYYLAMLLSLLLIYTVIGAKSNTWWDNSVPVSGRAVVSHLLLLQDYLDSTQINHVFWSVATEWHIYFLFPALLWLFRRLRNARATLLGVGICYVVSVLTVRQNLHIEMLGEFILGMFGATIAYSNCVKWQKRRDHMPWGLLALLCFGIAGTLGIAGHKIYGITIMLEPFIGIGAVSIILQALRPGPNPLRSLLDWKPAVGLGGFSYSLYLIHAPLIQVIWLYAIKPLNRDAGVSFLLLLAIGTPLIVLAAWLFSLFGERPFLNSPPPKSVEARHENLVHSPGHSNLS